MWIRSPLRQPGLISLLQLDSLPHRWSPPTDHWVAIRHAPTCVRPQPIAAGSTRGFELGPFRPWDMRQVPLEVGVEILQDKILCQAFPAKWVFLDCLAAFPAIQTNLSLNGDHLTARFLSLPKSSKHTTKFIIDPWPKGVLVPYTRMNFPVFAHCINYGQTLTSTEAPAQKHNTAWVQIREAILPKHIIANMTIGSSSVG